MCEIVNFLECEAGILDIFFLMSSNGPERFRAKLGLGSFVDEFSSPVGWGVASDERKEAATVHEGRGFEACDVKDGRGDVDTESEVLIRF